MRFRIKIEMLMMGFLIRWIMLRWTDDESRAMRQGHEEVDMVTCPGHQIVVPRWRGDLSGRDLSEKGWGPTSPGRHRLGLAMAMATMESLNVGSQLLGLQIGWKNHPQQGPPNLCRGIITSHVSWIFVSTYEGFDDLCVSLGTLKVEQSAVITFVSDVVGWPNPRQVTARRVYLHSVWFYDFLARSLSWQLVDGKRLCPKI